MKYNKSFKEDNQNLSAVQRTVRNHLVNYMDLKDWNKKGMSVHLGVPDSVVAKIFHADNNYTVRRLIDIAIKTNTKLVISFEPNKSETDADTKPTRSLHFSRIR
jgi:hypothetical protein